MNTIKIQVKKNHLEVMRRNVITTDNKGYIEFEFVFDSDWDGKQKQITLIRENGSPFTDLIKDDKYIVPVSVIASEKNSRKNITLEVGVFAIDSEQTITSDFVKLNITPGSYIRGKTPTEPSPDIYQQIIADKVNGLQIEDNQLTLLANGIPTGNSVVLPTGIGITSQDAMAALIETGMLPAVKDKDGAFLSIDGKIIMW